MYDDLEIPDFLKRSHNEPPREWRRLFTAEPVIAPAPARQVTPPDAPGTPSKRSPRVAPVIARSTQPGDLTTICDIAASLGIDPRHARAALRAAKFVKPSHGWSWTSSDAIIEDIEKIIAMSK